MRSQAICGSFLKEAKQGVIWIFSIFMTTLYPWVMSTLGLVFLWG